MLDINFIRENPEVVKTAIRNKGETSVAAVDQVIETDSRWRAAVHQADTIRNESNTRAKDIGRLMAEGKKDEAQAIIRQTGEMKEQLRMLEEQIRDLAAERNDLLLRIPNIPHPTVPVGRSETDNKVHGTWGDPSKDKWRKPHWEIAEEYGWIDFKRGVKVTGAGFPFYVGPAARLQRALINFFLDRATQKGYTEMQAPFFVNEDSARGTGQIPDKEDMMYVVPRDEFYAIPTAEVPVTNFHRDEIIEAGDLPVRYCCYTPCWRREAGSYGKEVRGLNRLHQFDKVELVKFVDPDTSYDELESLRRDAEELLEALNLPYRTLLMCTGDMGFTQSKKYDLEVWSPGQQRWLEVSSCSNFEGFQARRMMVRYRAADGKPRILHTLNGSGLALPRVMSAVLESYQEESGRIRVPDVLKSYIGSEYLA
jgi:seryl-tRNA synthetase